MKKSDLKALVTESILESLNQHVRNAKLNPDDYNTNPIVKQGGSDPAYELAKGKKVGLADKVAGRTRDISKYSKEFQKGYNMYRGDSWWSKMNDKLTNWVAGMGSSLIKR